MDQSHVVTSHRPSFFDERDSENLHVRSPAQGDDELIPETTHRQDRGRL
jgi:hypothetical protein